MTDDIRRKAEALVESCLTDFDHIGKPHIVDAVVAFTKAQRAAEVRAIQDKWNQQTGIADWWNWLNQRAKEWET